MTERAQAKEYYLECLDPEMLRRPQTVLRLRKSWHEGTYEPGAIDEHPEPDPWDPELDLEEPDSGEPPFEPNRSEAERVPGATFVSLLAIVVVLYFFLVLLRALYKQMSGDGS